MKKFSKKKNNKSFFVSNIKRKRRIFPFLYFLRAKTRGRYFFYRRKRFFFPKPKYLSLVFTRKRQKHFLSLLFFWLHSFKNNPRVVLIGFLSKKNVAGPLLLRFYMDKSFFHRFLSYLIDIKRGLCFDFFYINKNFILTDSLYIYQFLIFFKKSELVSTFYNHYYSFSRFSTFVGEEGFVPINGFYIYFNFLLTKYFSFLTNKPVRLFIYKKPTHVLSINDLIFLLFFINQSRFFRFKFIKVFKLSDFFGLLFFSIRWLDWTWLLERIQQILSSIRIFKHKLFWRFFILLIKRYIFAYFSDSWIRGIYISIRGKIGVVGNSRKRRLFWHIGSPSPSYFTKTIYYKNTFFRTPTGAIGFKVWLIR